MSFFKLDNLMARFFRNKPSSNILIASIALLTSIFTSSLFAGTVEVEIDPNIEDNYRLHYQLEVDRIFDEDFNSIGEEPDITKVNWNPKDWVIEEQISKPSSVNLNISQLAKVTTKMVRQVEYPKSILDSKSDSPLVFNKLNSFQNPTLVNTTYLLQTTQLSSSLKSSNLEQVTPIVFHGLRNHSIFPFVSNYLNKLDLIALLEKDIEFLPHFKSLSLWHPNLLELHSINFSMQCENFLLKSMIMKSASGWKFLCSLAKMTYQAPISNLLSIAHWISNPRKSMSHTLNMSDILSIWSKEMRGKGILRLDTDLMQMGILAQLRKSNQNPKGILEQNRNLFQDTIKI